MPTLERIRVYPVKSLDPCDLERATVGAHGGLSFDREYAVVEPDGTYVNGKNDRRVHRLRSWFDPKTGRLTLRPHDGDGDDARAFDLPDERGAVESFLTAYFDREVVFRREPAGGFPDDTRASGPTVISQATVEAVASWFDGIDPGEMLRRLRPNLVLGDCEAFWEDRLYADPDHAVEFRVGDLTLSGVQPCQRCVVPTRDPDTGEETPPDFQRTFVARREATLPPWANRTRFDHYFRLMVNTHVPEAEWDTDVAVGDEIEVLGRRPSPLD